MQTQTLIGTPFWPLLTPMPRVAKTFSIFAGVQEVGKTPRQTKIHLWDKAAESMLTLESKR